MIYIYSIVQFVPAIGVEERVNIGYFVGNNEEGFHAQWRPERTLLFGIDATKILGDWLDGLKPMSTEKLIDLSEIPRVFFQVTTPRIVKALTLEEAASYVRHIHMPTNEDYIRRWENQ